MNVARNVMNEQIVVFFPFFSLFFYRASLHSCKSKKELVLQSNQFNTVFGKMFFIWFEVFCELCSFLRVISTYLCFIFLFFCIDNKDSATTPHKHRGEIYIIKFSHMQWLNSLHWTKQNRLSKVTFLKTLDAIAISKRTKETTKNRDVSWKISRLDSYSSKINQTNLVPRFLSAVWCFSTAGSRVQLCAGKLKAFQAGRATKPGYGDRRDRVVRRLVCCAF